VLPVPPWVDGRITGGEAALFADYFLLVSILCVTGLTSCSSSPAAAATVWLCRPGLAHDPCTVFAPMYQQVTLSSVSSQQAQQIAYDSVLAAWRDYLAHYNHGCGVVLVGHSEGADQLDQLISGQIDNNASVRRLLVSASLTGANLTVGANDTGPPAFGPAGSVGTIVLMRIDAVACGYPIPGGGW
jgi:hypothetical protein